MRHLTEQERKCIENECDMLKGNINRMCVTDDIKELYKQADFARHRILKIENIVKSRFVDQSNECDMIKGNINRMCVTDDIEEVFEEVYKQANFAMRRMLKIENIVKSRFVDQSKEKEEGVR